MVLTEPIDATFGILDLNAIVLTESEDPTFDMRPMVLTEPEDLTFVIAELPKSPYSLSEIMLLTDAEEHTRGTFFARPPMPESPCLVSPHSDRSSGNMVANEALEAFGLSPGFCKALPNLP
jgi:hypothetical protein